MTRELVDAYRNLGGFTMIKTGRAKIDSKQKIDLSRKTCQELGLDALVIVGGDDSNTNAAFLAQEMFDDGIQVIGVPKTIDGDIQVRDDQGHVLCAVSFGFHTAARAFANADRRPLQRRQLRHQVLPRLQGHGPGGEPSGAGGGAAVAPQHHHHRRGPGGLRGRGAAGKGAPRQNRPTTPPSA
ncbi:MAG: 6-phosphofructokinase [Desulfobacterales bacterium]|nr:6-phosphofructokinase [Desulfobacterales bacterium]